VWRPTVVVMDNRVLRRIQRTILYLMG
jgi:hypothetical protein